MVLNAFTYFMFYDLPFNSTVRLVDMRNKESDVIEKTVLNEEDASWLVGLFPETDAEGESCVHCTIQRLLEVIARTMNEEELINPQNGNVSILADSTIGDD